jgi:hypothetical protein
MRLREGVSALRKVLPLVRVVPVLRGLSGPHRHPCAGGSARRAEPATRPPELARRGRGGAAEGHCQGGHGRETGRRWWVGCA